MSRFVKGNSLIVVMCLVQLTSLLGASAFVTLLPVFIDEWHLSGAQAGLLSGIYYAGYVIFVPFLVSLADTIDARSIFIWSSLLIVASLVGFGLSAEGFWSALILRFLGGVGRAGTYMTGLKALTDRLGARDPSRAVAFYTATFGLAGAGSIFLTGLIYQMAGWKVAFIMLGMGPVLSLSLIWLFLKPKSLPYREARVRWIPNFKPVFRNKPALGYMISYSLHTGELMTIGSWIVAFLVFSSSLQPEGTPLWDPVHVAAIGSLLGLVASLAGSEIATRIGRNRLIALAVVLSALWGAGLGFTAAMPFYLVAIFCLIYSTLTAIDSAAVTAGTVTSAESRYQGATMAAHSFIGFMGGFIAPILFGLILDLAGGIESLKAWGFAFASISLATLLAPITIRFLSSTGSSNAVLHRTDAQLVDGK